MTVRIVGIGGSTEPGSRSEAALHAVLAAVAGKGAEVTAFTGQDLDFAPYFPGVALPSAADSYLAEVRRADAIVIASPGYHGTVSGLIKNAVDYLEELSNDQRPYLHGRAVGLVAVANGWQATVNTLGTLRQITHALRGWPTPFGVSINTAVTNVAQDVPLDESTARAIDIMASQMIDFGRKMKID